MKSWEQKLVKTEQGELKAFDPITKELSDVGSGGSGGGGTLFIMTIYGDENENPATDTTYEELLAAKESGMPIYVKDQYHDGGDAMPFPVLKCDINISLYVINTGTRPLGVMIWTLSWDGTLSLQTNA